MKTFQARTLETIEAIAAKYGVECTQSSDWANTGHVNLHAPGVPAAFGLVSYDFQGSTFVLRLTIDGRKIPAQAGRADYFDFYQRTDAPSAFWATFEQLLKSRKGKPVQQVDRQLRIG